MVVGQSFEINQDDLMSNILQARNEDIEKVEIECPTCAHKIAFLSKGFTISEFPYRIVRKNV